jgi:hypothetical protein
MKRITMIVLGAFLILSGLVGLVSGLGNLGLVIDILALAAGVLILVYTPGISYRAGWFLAATYLIIIGLAGMIGFSFGGMDIVLAILALAAGIVLLVRMPKIRKNIGYLLFFIWLILVGLTGLVGLGALGILVSIVALAAGILLILDV